MTLPRHDLLQHIEESIFQRKLFRDGRRILLAVSGGLDSMVLLHALHTLAGKHRWRLAVAHFNHQLRGAASDEDQRLVFQTANRAALPLFTGHWPRDKHKAKGLSMEMSARLARHQFLCRAAEEFKARTIALAHHADDQAELFLLRLLRGSGGEGLGGMRWSGPSPVDGRLTVVRPLMDLRKEALRDYACRHRIRFREDASNRNVNHDRNWLRKSLLPALTCRFGPAVVPNLLRAMELTAAEADFARGAADHWLAERRPRSFSKLHVALQRHVVRLQLKRLGLPLGFDLVESLRLTPGKAVSATPETRVRRDAAGRVTRDTVPARGTFRFDELRVDLGKGARCEFNGVTFNWKRNPMRAPFRRPKPQPGRESFDAGKVGTHIALRHWRPGDRFQPIGMKQPVKLQDLFTNAKFSKARRHETIVAETKSGEIFWVEGLRIGERFKLDTATRERLRWRWSVRSVSGSTSARHAD